MFLFEKFLFLFAIVALIQITSSSETSGSPSSPTISVSGTSASSETSHTAEAPVARPPIQAGFQGPLSGLAGLNNYGGLSGLSGLWGAGGLGAAGLSGASATAGSTAGVGGVPPVGIGGGIPPPFGYPGFEGFGGGLLGPSYYPYSWLGALAGLKGDIFFPLIIIAFFFVGIWTVASWLIAACIPLFANKGWGLGGLGSGSFSASKAASISYRSVNKNSTMGADHDEILKDKLITFICADEKYSKLCQGN